MAHYDLERGLNEHSEHAATSVEHDWKGKLERARLQHEDSIVCLRKEFEMELAASKQKLDRALSLESSYQDASRELGKLKGKLDQLTSELSDAKREVAERDELVQATEKRAAENQETIDSLKVVIGDFSRSVDGYLLDREDRDETIASLKAVIDDMHRSIGADEPKN